MNETDNKHNIAAVAVRVLKCFVYEWIAVNSEKLRKCLTISNFLIYQDGYSEKIVLLKPQFKWSQLEDNVLRKLALEARQTLEKPREL